MAKRKRAVKKRAAGKGAKKGGKSEAALSLAQFAAQVRTRLSKLEREIQNAEATKQLTRMLRDASHQLGKWEAAGEKRWKKLTAKARADALKLLKRIEKSLSPAPAKPKAAPKPVAAASPAPRPAFTPRPPAPAPMSTPPVIRPPISSPSGIPPRGEGQEG